MYSDIPVKMAQQVVKAITELGNVPDGVSAMDSGSEYEQFSVITQHAKLNNMASHYISIDNCFFDLPCSVVFLIIKVKVTL
jgi:hypothetical protein